MEWSVSDNKLIWMPGNETVDRSLLAAEISGLFLFMIVLLFNFVGCILLLFYTRALMIQIFTDYSASLRYQLLISVWNRTALLCVFNLYINNFTISRH